jgi:Pilus formation protein N terminal region
MIRDLSKLIFSAAVLCTTAQFAQAETPKLRIPVDESQILQLATTPGAIIIGNPSIADVSIQGQKLFIHGRSFGQTNLTILDLQGNQVATFDLVSVASRDDSVTIFANQNGGNGRGFRFTYNCLEACEATTKVGDDLVYFKTTEEAIKKKSELATGSETSEAKAPEAPQ